MDPVGIGIVAIVIVGLVLVWRRTQPRRTPEETLEAAALRAERDRGRTDATYHHDRMDMNH